MNNCCVISCPNKRKEKKFRFFNFPQDPIKCEKWVECCHCPETWERFNSGGPPALRKYGVCSEHFDQVAVKLAGDGPLPPRAFPINIGRTHMTPAMLAERGFHIDDQHTNEANDSEEHFEMPEVLVEMLDPLEDESGINGPLQPVKKIRRPAAKTTPATKESLNAAEAQERAKCKKLCLLPEKVRFQNLYRFQRKRNRRVERALQGHKQTLATLNGQLQRYTDLRALKAAKKEKLRARYMELQKLYKKGILHPTKEPAVTEESEDEDDFDENDAWWT